MLRIIKCKNLLLKKLSTFPMTNLKSTKGKIHLSVRPSVLSFLEQKCSSKNDQNACCKINLY